MAIERNVTAVDHVFLGEDKILEFAIYADHAMTTPVDVSGWDLIWVLRKKDGSADPALIEKETGDGITVVGAFDSDPAANTQRVRVTLLDTDTYDPEASPAVELRKGKYRHSLKRLDDGSETILVFGSFQFLQATSR